MSSARLRATRVAELEAKQEHRRLRRLLRTHQRFKLAALTLAQLDLRRFRTRHGDHFVRVPVVLRLAGSSR
jgi:hypothetical protein